MSIFVISIINNSKLKEEFKTSGFVEFSDFKKVNKLMKKYELVGIDEVDFFNNLNTNSKIFWLISVEDVTEQKYNNGNYLYTFKTTIYPYSNSYENDYESLKKWSENSKEITAIYEGKKIEDKYLNKINSDNDVFMFYGFGTYNGNYNVSLDYIFYNLVDK